VLELNYEMLTRSYTVPYKYYIFENMRNSWDKLGYFLKGFNIREKVYYLFPMLDRKNNLKYIYDKLRGHSDADFSEVEHYLGRGFVSDGEIFEEDNCEKWNMNGKIMHSRSKRIFRQDRAICEVA